MSSAADRWRAALIATGAADLRPPEPPRCGVCVYCGKRTRHWLACPTHVRLLALDPNYADASGRMDETDYLPETDEDAR